MIKVIELDFNSIKLPYNTFQKIKLCGINSQSYELSRIITLDIHRAGVSLFYKPIYITFSSLILANYFVTGIFVPGIKKIDNIYEKEDNLEEEKEVKVKKGVCIKGMPPSFLIKLPSYDREEFCETFNNEEKENMVCEDEEDEEFLKWLAKCYPDHKKLKIHKIFGEVIRDY